jgi:hypothetical protein
MNASDFFAFISFLVSLVRFHTNVPDRGRNLNFVEDQQIDPGFYGVIHINGKVREDSSWTKILIKKLIQVRIFFKIAVYDFLVLVTAKLLKNKGLARLACTLQKKRFPSG